MHQWQKRENAATWDAGRGTHLPTRAEQQDVLLALLTASRTRDGPILDLGIGSGLVAEAVLEALPHAQLVGLDFSPPMLDLARARLHRFGSRIHLCLGDLSTPWEIHLPLHRYRATFSVQTLHHLGDREKARAFAWMTELVEPGGLVVVIDRVKVEKALFEDWQVAWRRVDPSASGTYADYVAELAEGGDHPARLEDQIAWMTASGLAACCLHLYGDRAVLVGRKPS